MALRNATSASASASVAEAEKPVTGTPAFEGMDETNSDAGAIVDNNTTVVDPDDLPASTTTAVAVAAPQAVVVRPLFDRNTTLRGLKNSIPPDELEGMGIGVFPRITASQGGFVVNKNEKKLGTRIRFGVISWNYIDMVVTGEQNNPEANKLIRSSRDGKEISATGTNPRIGDGSIKAYVDYLVADGYKKATVKRYIELYGNLIGYEKTNEQRQIVKVDIPEDEQKLYQVSLSPQSVGQWGKYLMEGGLRKARGHSDDSVVTLIQCEKTLGSNTFALAEFEPKW